MSARFAGVWEGALKAIFDRSKERDIYIFREVFYCVFFYLTL